MDTSSLITFVFFSLIFIYIITKILNFYDINASSYGIYLTFFIFILLSIAVLPNSYPET